MKHITEHERPGVREQGVPRQGPGRFLASAYGEGSVEGVAIHGKARRNVLEPHFREE